MSIRSAQSCEATSGCSALELAHHNGKRQRTRHDGRGSAQRGSSSSGWRPLTKGKISADLILLARFANGANFPFRCGRKPVPLGRFDLFQHLPLVHRIPQVPLGVGELVGLALLPCFALLGLDTLCLCLELCLLALLLCAEIRFALLALGDLLGLELSFVLARGTAAVLALLGGMWLAILRELCGVRGCGDELGVGQ